MPVYPGPGYVPPNDDDPAFDEGGGGGDDGGMETRLRAVEQAIVRIDTVLSTLATKAELQAVRTDIAEAKASIIMWVVGAIFLAQLLPALPALLRALKLIS